MISKTQWLMMTTAAALCAVPLLAFGQANTGGSSMQPQTTQTTPQSGPLSGAPAARDAATTGTQITPGPSGHMAPGAAGPNPDLTQMERIRQNEGNTTGTDAPPGPAGAPAATVPPSGAMPPRAAVPAPATAVPTTTGATGPAGAMAVDSARLRGARRATKVIGSTVYNENNESIGEVDDIIVPPGGHPPVAVLSVGGFLGIGARLVAVPYERLRWNDERERWTLQGATRDSLQSLPAYAYEGRG